MVLRFYKYFLFVCSALFVACVKDQPKVISEEPPASAVKHKVFIVNEGNYGAANASLTYYNSNDNKVTEDYYQFQNKTSIGDVLQSIHFFNHTYYLVVNNSNKILICDSNFKKLNQINGLISPRYFLPISNNKAYVSDLYANQIQVIDLNSNSKTGSIRCPGWTENMLLQNSKVFVTNVTRDYLYVINVLNDKIADSILVGPNASSVVEDKLNHIWVLSSGDKNKSKLAQLTKINTDNNQIISQYVFTSNDEPNQLCLNKTKDTLYYLNKGICRMAITQSSLPNQVFVAQNNSNFYGLGVNPYDYHIYVSDALDYIQKSNCYVYNTNGQQVNLFKAGINANAFYFE